MKPVNVIHLILDEEFFEKVGVETNRYASQCLEGISRKRHGMAEWTPVDVAEKRKFFDLLFLMGLNDRPAIRLY